MKASAVDGYPKGNKMKILIEGTDASQSECTPPCNHG